MFTAGGQPDLYVVMRGGGGKGGGGSVQQAPVQAPTYVDPVTGKAFTDPNWSVDQRNSNPNLPTGADLLNQEIDQRNAAAKATSDAAAQAASQKATDTENQFQTTKQQLAKDAEQSIGNTFTQQGLDPAQYWSTDIQPAIQRQLDSIPDLAPNPGSAFSPTLGQDILNGITSGQRTQATNQLNQVFTPNYANTLIPDSTLDQYVGSAVNSQFDPLSSQLTNAQKRGTLTDVGYNAALAALNTKKSAATSQVTNLGQSILGTDRSGINDIISGARSDVAGLSPGQTFDPSSYTSRASDLAKTDLSGFGGALTNAIGGTQFATLTDLLNAGGSVQGANNPNAMNPAGSLAATSPFYTDPGTSANEKRGLGNTGAF